MIPVPPQPIERPGTEAHSRLLAGGGVKMKILEAPEVVGLLIEYGRRAQLAGGKPYRARAS